MNVKYTITPEIHEKIKAVYLGAPARGQVKALAKKLQLPPWKISRYALRHGWIQTQKKPPLWSEQELSLLKSKAHLTPERIQIHLKKNGFKRSLTGIVLKRKRMRLLSNLKGQSATQVALCLGVDSQFVTRAIKAGELTANRRGTDRTDAQGGDMFFIKDSAIKKWIVENIHYIDIRKVDKYWFTDILTGRV